MPYKNAVIYYWSGTGNSYRVSTWMAKIIEEKGFNIRILSIDKEKSIEENKSEYEDLIGIVFPTHGFTAPWHILKFVWSLPQNNSKHVFCVATRGGLKFGPVFTPGISGSATFIISYYIFNTLVRVPAINWIFTHTTMTHWYRWGRYREPNTQLKNISVR